MSSAAKITPAGELIWEGVHCSVLRRLREKRGSKGFTWIKRDF